MVVLCLYRNAKNKAVEEFSNDRSLRNNLWEKPEWSFKPSQEKGKEH